MALIIISLVLVVSLVANGILTYFLVDYQRVCDVLVNKKIELEEMEKTMMKVIEAGATEISFYESHVVFVLIDGTNEYHKYSCSKFKPEDYDFLAFNLNAAIHEGYEPCPKCH